MHVRRLFSGLNPRIVQASADTPTEVRPSQAATSGPGLAGGASAASLPKSRHEWKASRPAASINVAIAAQQHRPCSRSPLISTPFTVLEVGSCCAISDRAACPVRSREPRWAFGSRLGARTEPSSGLAGRNPPGQCSMVTPTSSLLSSIDSGARWRSPCRRMPV
jgi:hypothetical protein